MRQTETTAGVLLQSALFDRVPGVIHGFGVRGPDAAAYLDAMGIADRYLPTTNQVHGARVHYLVRPGGGRTLEGDAFISDRPGMVCFVRTADCVPILVADTKRPAVAAIHAGWRGTAADVAGEAIRAMGEVFGTRPADCVAAVGPRICGSCYEVGPEVIKAMRELDLGDGWRSGERHVDLGKANAELLARAGLDSASVAVFPRCTACEPDFISWRRDRTVSGRQFNFIMIDGSGVSRSR